MKYTPTVITIGGATEDIFFTVDDYVLMNNPKDLLHKKLLAFEYGAKIGIPEITSASGGGAANAAVAFSRLGFRSTLLAALGDDIHNRTIVHNLLKNRVKTSLLEVVPHIASGLSLILVKPGNDHVVFTYRGANDYLKITRRHERAIRKADWVYLTSLSKDWKLVLKAIFSVSKRLAWNPGRQQIAAGLKTLAPFLKQTEVLICNKDEALELVSSATSKTPAATLNNSKYLVRSLQKYVAGMVIVTDGEKGALLYDGKKLYQQKVVKAKHVVDTTGVGDAFGASFIAGMTLYNNDYAKALELAAKNASAVVSKMGAQTGLLSHR